MAHKEHVNTLGMYNALQVPSIFLSHDPERPFAGYTPITSSAWHPKGAILPLDWIIGFPVLLLPLLGTGLWQ